jgi:aspartyl-tRNA(Asn)/glutamyl-tRNA(Gln) amidotransferase subunit C
VSLTRDEVLHIARLARLGLAEEDVSRFQGQLSQILDQFEALRAIDTDDVPPTAYTLPLENVWREDEVRPSLSPDQVLANAPLREGQYFRVRRVLE